MATLIKFLRLNISPITLSIFALFCLLFISASNAAIKPAIKKDPSKTAKTPIIVTGMRPGDYFSKLLTLALSFHPDKQYEIKYMDNDVPKLRAFRLIEQKLGIDLIPAGATHEREKRLLPVRIPILKGLFGWRVALVHEQNISIFNNATNLASIKTFTAGQLRTWSDVEILESNGIRVEKGANFQGLFKMLDKQRFDYFPRSILQVTQELNDHRHFQLALEPHILIHYPTAYYYYVNQQNLELAKDIESGLEAAISSGRFEQLFQQKFNKVLDKFKSHNRRVIELHNPYLPNATPLDRQELWFHF